VDEREVVIRAFEAASSLKKSQRNNCSRRLEPFQLLCRTPVNESQPFHTSVMIHIVRVTIDCSHTP